MPNHLLLFTVWKSHKIFSSRNCTKNLVWRVWPFGLRYLLQGSSEVSWSWILQMYNPRVNFVPHIQLWYVTCLDSVESWFAWIQQLQFHWWRDITSSWFCHHEPFIWSMWWRHKSNNRSVSSSWNTIFTTVKSVKYWIYRGTVSANEYSFHSLPHFR